MSRSLRSTLSGLDMPMVHIPALLLSLTGGICRQEVSGTTVREVVEELNKVYPGIRDRLLEGERLRSGLAVFVDGLVRREGLDFTVSHQSEIYFIPAVAGGCVHEGVKKSSAQGH